MPSVQPIFLPRPVVEENRLVLANDFGAQPCQFCFGPGGRLYVLSKLFYNYYRYDNNDSRGFSTWLVNVYGADLAPERIADFSALYEAIKGRGESLDYFDWDRFDPYLAVTPDALVVLTTRANRAFLFDAALETARGRFAAPDSGDLQRVYDEGFAYHSEPTGDGKLLCLVSEPGLRQRWFSPNLICLSDGSALGPKHRPGLTCFACLKDSLSDNATFPYVRLPDGERAGRDSRPAPSLEDQVKRRFEPTLLFNPWLGQALPLDEKRSLVSLFSQHLRGGSKGLGFVFAIVSTEGEIVGRVEGIDQRAESPYVEHHYRLAVDRKHGRIVYKNKTSCFHFNLEGRRLAQVRLEGKPLRSLAALKLGGCGPDGRIIFHHPDQHFLAVTDPVTTPRELADTLAALAARIAPERNRLKKQYEWTHSRWLHPGPVVRH